MCRTPGRRCCCRRRALRSRARPRCHRATTRPARVRPTMVSACLPACLRSSLVPRPILTHTSHSNGTAESLSISETEEPVVASERPQQQQQQQQQQQLQVQTPQHVSAMAAVLSPRTASPGLSPRAVTPRQSSGGTTTPRTSGFFGSRRASALSLATSTSTGGGSTSPTRVGTSLRLESDTCELFGLALFRNTPCARLLPHGCCHACGIDVVADAALSLSLSLSLSLAPTQCQTRCHTEGVAAAHVAASLHVHEASLGRDHGQGANCCCGRSLPPAPCVRAYLPATRLASIEQYIPDNKLNLNDEQVLEGVYHSLQSALLKSFTSRHLTLRVALWGSELNLTLPILRGAELEGCALSRESAGDWPLLPLLLLLTPATRWSIPHNRASLTKLVQLCEHDTMVLWYALMYRKRLLFIGQPAELCTCRHRCCCCCCSNAATCEFAAVY